jgi:hypothetical protein
VAGNNDTNTTTVTAAKTVGRPADKAARRPRRVRPHRKADGAIVRAGRLRSEM